MRQISSVLALVIVSFVAVSAQPSRANGQRTRKALDAQARREVLATDARRTDALLRGDPGPLREIYADDYTLVTPAGVIHNKVDQIEDLTSNRLRYKKINVLEQSVRVYGDVVIVVSREKNDIVRDGQQVGGDIRVTRTYKKFGTHWRVIATHASAVAQ